MAADMPHDATATERMAAKASDDSTGENTPKASDGSDGKKTALIIVDMQNDFCPPHGAIAVEGGRELAHGINDALENRYTLKIATRDYHPADHVSFATQHPGATPFTSTHTIANPLNPQEQYTTTLWPPHCVQGTVGCELIPELHYSKIDFVVNKGDDEQFEQYSAFGLPFKNPPLWPPMTGLTGIMKEHCITKACVAGLALDYCVKHTAIDAAKEGFDTEVLMNLSKAVDQSNENIAAVWKELEDNGVKPRYIRPDDEDEWRRLCEYTEEIKAMVKALRSPEA